MKTRAITEGALMAAITVVIALLSYFIPFFSILSFFLLPLPTTILYKQQGGVVAGISAVAATLILLFFMDPFNALLLGVTVILPGLLIGRSYRENEDGGLRIVYGYVAYLTTIIIEMILFNYITGVSLLDDFINEVNASVKTLDELYSVSGAFDATELAQLEESVNQQAEALKMLFPTIIVVSPAVLSWLTILIDDYFFKRTKQSYQPVKPMADWFLSNPAKVILALITFISVIAQQMITDQAYSLYPYTAVTIVNMIYLVMGLSFIFWFYQKRFHRKLYWLRFLTVLLIGFVPGLGFIVTLAGILDVYIGLRKYFDK